MVTQGNAWKWIALYLRILLWQNGIAGNKPLAMQKRILQNTEVISLCKLMSRRLRTRCIQNELFQFDSLLSYMYAWREIDSPKIVCRCLRRICQEDDGFLNLLLRLRTVIVSSTRGYYRELRIDDISRLIGLKENDIKSRLHSLKQQHDRDWIVDELYDSLENEL